MNRLVTVLVVTGGAFLLMHGSRTNVAQGFGYPEGCCDEDHAEWISLTLCDLCQPNAPDHGTCTPNPDDNQIAGSCTGGSGGSLKIHQEITNHQCGQINDSIYCDLGSACPNDYAWKNWLPSPECVWICNHSGEDCSPGNECCPGNVCSLNTHKCVACGSNYGQSCAPESGGNYCSHYTCDGYCPPQCNNDSQCGSGKRCQQGCCCAC
jgi:hypothetical protein